eukprot:scaffold9072_cov49-Attheya_sp.AAC.2
MENIGLQWDKTKISDILSCQKHVNKRNWRFLSLFYSVKKSSIEGYTGVVVRSRLDRPILLRQYV